MTLLACGRQGCQAVTCERTWRGCRRPSSGEMGSHPTANTVLRSENEEGVAVVSEKVYTDVTRYHAQIGSSVKKDALLQLEWNLLAEAKSLFHQHKYEEALNTFTHCLAVTEKSRSAKDHAVRGAVVHNIASCLHNLGEMEAAQAYYEQAIDAFKRAKISPVERLIFGDPNKRRMEFVKERLVDISWGRKPDGDKYLDENGNKRDVPAAGTESVASITQEGSPTSREKQWTQTHGDGGYRAGMSASGDAGGGWQDDGEGGLVRADAAATHAARRAREAPDSERGGFEARLAGGGRSGGTFGDVGGGGGGGGRSQPSWLEASAAQPRGGEYDDYYGGGGRHPSDGDRQGGREHERAHQRAIEAEAAAVRNLMLAEDEESAAERALDEQMRRCEIAVDIGSRRG